MLDVRNVYIVGGDRNVEYMFITEGWGICDDLMDADLMVFTGGEDVSPSLYNQHPHKTTSFNTYRDEEEMEQYLIGAEQGLPMVGICRGGQFLNVMNGGSLYQHVDGHALGKTHKAFIKGAVIPIDVTSTHHQMMIPCMSVDHEVLITAQESKRKLAMSSVSYGEYEVSTMSPTTSPSDVECVFYPNTQCLCFQPHPEYEGIDDTKEVFFTFLDRYLFSSTEIAEAS